MKNRYFLIFVGLIALLVLACESTHTESDDLMVEYKAEVLVAKDIVERKQNEADYGDLEYYYSVMRCLDNMGLFWEQMLAICAETDDCVEGGGMASHMSGAHMGAGHMNDVHMMTPEEMFGMNDIEVQMMDEMEVFNQACLSNSEFQEKCEGYKSYHLNQMESLLDLHLDICDSMTGHHSEHH